MIHPLLPVAHDWWEHEFNATEHLSHVHDRYGNDHLDKELNKSNSESNTNKNQNSLKSEDQVSFHVFPIDCAHKFSVNKFDIQHKFFKISKPLSVFISIKAPPPKLFLINT